MTNLNTIVLVVHVLVGVMMVGLILIQRGKGADAGAAFGSGASGTVFGARGSERSWVLAIVRNQAIDLLRRRLRQREQTLDDWLAIDPAGRDHAGFCPASRARRPGRDARPRRVRWRVRPRG